MLGPVSEILLRSRGQKFKQAQRDPMEAQERAFQRLRRKSASITANCYQDFIKDSKPQSYQNIEPEFKNQLESPQKSKLVFAAITSGTTGPRKKIPINTEVAHIFKKSQLTLASILLEKTGQNPIVSPSVTWTGPANLGHLDSGLPYGLISGFLSGNAPKFLRKQRFPSELCNELCNLEEKADALAIECRDQDIRFIAAMPNYMQQLSRTLNRKLSLNNLSELWPNLEALIFSGSPIGPYRDELKKSLGKDLPFYGIYFSSEAPIGFEADPVITGRHAYQLNLEDVVFSFKKEDGSIHGVGDLNLGDEVDLLLSMANGLEHYQNGDRLRVVQTTPKLLFEVLGRSGEAMSIFGEKITERDLEVILQNSQDDLLGEIQVEHFFIYPDEDETGKPFYHWVLVTDDQFSHEKLAHSVDKTTQTASFPYQLMRHKLETIGPAQVTTMGREAFNQYFERVGFSKQLKVKRIFNTAAMFHDFRQNL